MIDHCACGILTTVDTLARISACVIHAGFMPGTLRIKDARRSAADLRIPNVIEETSASFVDTLGI